MHLSLRHNRALQIVGGGITQKLSAYALGRAFADLEFERVKRNHTRGYVVVQRSAEEIKARQRLLGTDGTEGTEVF